MAEAETSGDHAEQLVEEIEAGALDPADVDLTPFVEDDMVAMTPALWQHLPEDKREAYNERIAEREESEVAEERQELTREQRDTLDALEGAITDTESSETTTVMLGDAEVTVSKRLSGRVEQALDRIREESQKPAEQQSLDAIVEDLLDGITGLIIDDTEPEADPYRFTDREVWRQFYLANGSEALLDIFETVAEPARERRERLESFRNDRRGDGGA